MVKPWRYGLGEFALGLPGTLVSAYLMFHYQDSLGLAAGYIAIAKVINAIWDGINDPVVGHLSDRTRSRLGRRLPWLLFAIPANLIFSVVAFMVPGGLTGGALFAYYLAVLVLWETTATMAWIPFQSLLPQLFPTEEGRIQTSTYRKVNYFVAQILGFVLTPILAGTIGLVNVSLLYCLLGGAAAFGLLHGLKEPPSLDMPAPSSDGLAAFLRSVLATLRHTTYRYFLVVHALTQLTLALQLSGMAYYAKYSLNLNGWQTSAFFGSVFLMTIPGLFLWARVAGRLGAPRTLSVSLGCFALAAGALALVPNLPLALLAGAAAGISLAGFVVTGDVVIARIADRDHALTGESREGMFYSVIWVVARGANVLQAASFWLLAVLFGYVSGDQPGEQPGLAFRVLMGGIPFAGLTLAFLASLGLAAAMRRNEAAESGVTGVG